ncbi:ABC transporter ATP-binding protein [Streptomyces sp. ME01-18a]|uniref:ABC transporter ATP-binding protein n=1 Tax=Streptomyces sp. ME01-18a TaxID=3028669 RepID=UPI0029B59B9E|nr:ABC transporter ATP-binding protein [Streptomyces sp. ME01-18a]MDX3433945.1 ABC transporter ATP-binding protein [Streptomyces sp. ME01-18a]
MHEIGPELADLLPLAAEALSVVGLSKRYGERQAVDSVAFQVRQGEFFGLLGPNGAGKTTIVEIAEGLRQADSGTVRLLGAAPWPRNLALLPRIGVQTQSSAFFVRQTVREHLSTVAALYGAERQAVDRTLEMVALTAQRDAMVENLSGGQRQKLAIASALVHDPELIFLDEPTAALDPRARRDLWHVLRGLKDAGRTVVYTTHHLEEAEALCDQVAILVDGRIVALDSPHSLVAGAGTPTQIFLAADRMTVAEAEGIPGVTCAILRGGSLVLETQASGKVLTALDARGGLDGVQTRTATLEDVYLSLTSATGTSDLTDSTVRTEGEPSRTNTGHQV